MNQIEVFENVGKYLNKNVLPTAARLCLISTFLDDGLRLLFNWTTHSNYVASTWGCGKFIGNMFVIISLVGQLASCGMVLIRKRVDVGCGVLFSCMILQTLVYPELWDKYYLLRHLSLVGALMFVLAEARGEMDAQDDGLPKSEDHYKLKMYMQLTGRILLIIMYLTILRFDSAVALILQDIVGGIMMALVVIGYRTKLAALMLVMLLSFIDLTRNDFWNATIVGQRNYLKYEFFQLLSVIGGLLMLVYLGPGDASLDERKKMM